MRFDKGQKEIQVNFALIRRCGGTFSLRAKSRLQRLRSDTRLRAQPLGGRLFHAISPASTATFNRRFPFPVRLFLARASAFKIFAAPAGVSPPHCSCP